MTSTRAKTAFRLPEPFDGYSCSAPNQLDNECHKLIASVMPFLSQEIGKFLRGMNPRQRSQFDMDDLLQEIWQVLSEKHEKYDNVRPFITWAGFILNQHLRELVNKSRIVNAPRDTHARLAEPCGQPRKTLLAIERATRDTATLDGCQVSETEGSAAESVERVHAEQFAVQAIGEAVKRLESIEERMVISRLYGLYGRSPLSIAEISRILKVSSAQVIQIKQSAESKLRKDLGSLGVNLAQS